MKYIKFSLLLIITTPIIMVNGDILALSENTRYFSYSRYNPIRQEWTNMTITGDTYEIKSDNSAYNGFKSKLLMSPWDSIAIEVKKSKFFEVLIQEDNPHTVLEIMYEGKRNMQSISQVDIEVNGLLDLAEIILYRLTGYSNSFFVWPIDFQVIIMESYPEQYSITVKFQRGNDLLAYVHEENATLIVSDKMIFTTNITTSNDINALHFETKKISIASGGQSGEFIYNTFSVGTNYAPSVLIFTVILESGVFLYYTPDGYNLPILNDLGKSKDIPFNFITPTYSTRYEQSTGKLEVALPTLLIISAVMIIPLLRRKYFLSI